MKIIIGATRRYLDNGCYVPYLDGWCEGQDVFALDMGRELAGVPVDQIPEAVWIATNVAHEVDRQAVMRIQRRILAQFPGLVRALCVGDTVTVIATNGGIDAFTCEHLGWKPLTDEQALTLVPQEFRALVA